MRIKNIENTSNESIQLKLGTGLNLTLDPGSSFQNIRVENLDQIKDRVRVTTDLGEINENNLGKTKLYD